MYTVPARDLTLSRVIKMRKQVKKMASPRHGPPPKAGFAAAQKVAPQFATEDEAA
jgi:hypothetical protein